MNNAPTGNVFLELQVPGGEDFWGILIQPPPAPTQPSPPPPAPCATPALDPTNPVTPDTWIPGNTYSAWLWPDYPDYYQVGGYDSNIQISNPTWVSPTVTTFDGSLVPGVSIRVPWRNSLGLVTRSGLTLKAAS